MKTKTFHGADGSPYLTRRELLRIGQFRVYLHRFHRADADPEFHDHPWSFLSVLLWGGYVEEELTVAGIVRRHARPFTVRFRGARRAHRIAALPNGEALSVIITGPKVGDWGFWRPVHDGLEYIPWRTFFAARDVSVIEPERSSAINSTP